MKKLLSLFALLAIVITMVACGVGKDNNPIDYGKKYFFNEDQYYVFNEDQTGYYVCYYQYEDTLFFEYGYTLSGRIDFVWREASNGAIYLFETQTTYNEDHTEGKDLGLITDPIYFSEEFFTYSYSTQYGGRTVNYIKEGSDLAKSLEK